MKSFSRRAIALLAAGALAASLTACASASSSGDDGSGLSGPSDGGDAKPQTGGTAVAAAVSEMAGFDPVRLSTVGTGLERAALVMDTLMYRDEKTDEVRPKLAESLQSDDGRIWVLTLRDGVMFSDGTPLDADAVVFNLERHAASDSTSTVRSQFAGVTSIEATGPLEVTVTFDKPNGSFPLTLSDSSAASLIGSPKALADPDEFNVNPVGAGPFLFESWTRDSELRLVRYDDYFVEGQPYLDGVDIKVLPDSQGRVDAVLSGSVMSAIVTGTNWATIEKRDDMVISRVAAGGQALVLNGSKGPMKDERVRQAIGMAFDPKVTNQVVFPGSDLWDGNRDCLPFPEGSPACVEGTAPAYDMEQAKQLIAAYLADGGDPVVDYIAPGVTDEISYYQRQMSETGLDVKLRVSDVGGWQTDMAKGNYDVTFVTTGSAGYPVQFNYMHPEGRFWGQVEYPELNDALDRARNAVELDDRNAAWQDVSKIAAAHSILFWESPFSNATAYSKKLHLGSKERPYSGSYMIFWGEAWLER